MQQLLRIEEYLAMITSIMISSGRSIIIIIIIDLIQKTKQIPFYNNLDQKLATYGGNAIATLL